MEKERDNLRNEITRQHDLLDDLREELKQAKAAFQSEKARHQDEVIEFRYKNKDREALVTALAKYKVLVDGRAGPMSLKKKTITAGCIY